MFKIKTKGYTLIELLVVVGIIGILVGVSVPGISQYSQRIAFVGVVDNFENLFRESFSQARSGPFYPFIFIRNTSDESSVEVCRIVPLSPEEIEAGEVTYPMIDGTYFCEVGTYESLDLENVFISDSQYVFEDVFAGEIEEEFENIGIEYFPPYGDLKVYTQDEGVAWAYPPNQNSEAMKSISFTFSNGIDFETITLYQTGLVERYKGALKNDA